MLSSHAKNLSLKLMKPWISMMYISTLIFILICSGWLYGSVSRKFYVVRSKIETWLEAFWFCHFDLLSEFFSYFFFKKKANLVVWLKEPGITLPYHLQNWRNKKEQKKRSDLQLNTSRISVGSSSYKLFEQKLRIRCIAMKGYHKRTTPWYKENRFNAS